MCLSCLSFSELGEHRNLSTKYERTKTIGMNLLLYISTFGLTFSCDASNLCFRLTTASNWNIVMKSVDEFTKSKWLTWEYEMVTCPSLLFSTLELDNLYVASFGTGDESPISLVGVREKFLQQEIKKLNLHNFQPCSIFQQIPRGRRSAWKIPWRRHSSGRQYVVVAVFYFRS